MIDRKPIYSVDYMALFGCGTQTVSKRNRPLINPAMKGTTNEQNLYQDEVRPSLQYEAVGAN